MSVKEHMLSAIKLPPQQQMTEQACVNQSGKQMHLSLFHFVQSFNL